MRRVLSAFVLLAVVASATAAQQDTRASLLRQATAALDDFAPERARDLARAALDPAFGVPDTLWVRGVHMLTQILSEAGEESVAQTWARWAMRTNPTMRIDSVNFVPGVVTALKDARTNVVGSRTAGDDVTSMAFQWAARGSQETQGRLRFDPSTMPVPVNVVVRGVGLLPAGQGVSIAPGSYEIEVAAQGYLPARIVREVLPGITLTLSFRLTSAVVASATIAENVRQSAYRSVASLSTTRFGAPPACAAGTVVSGQGRLVLTTYSAIRGATAISAGFMGSTTPITDVRVAAYDATANLAVLLLPAARPDSSGMTANVIESQAVWGVGMNQCSTRTDTRALVNEWQQRPLGNLRLSETIAQGVPGTPLVDYQGRLTGIWTGGTDAIAAPNAMTLLTTARTNITAQQTLALVDVARRENHLYGSIQITSDVPTARVAITQLEGWHWRELATTGAAPMTFSGPMGRYRIEVSSTGLPTRTQDVVVRAGETVRANVALRTVAGSGAPAASARRGPPKWVWIAGGGVAVAAIALGGGGGGGGGGSNGGLTVYVPNP
jgi:hypothetical protein